MLVTALLREPACHMGSHIVTSHPAEAASPRPYPGVVMAGTLFIHPLRMKGWVDLSGSLKLVPASRVHDVNVLHRGRRWFCRASSRCSEESRRAWTVPTRASYAWSTVCSRASWASSQRSRPRPTSRPSSRSLSVSTPVSARSSTRASPTTRSK